MNGNAISTANQRLTALGVVGLGLALLTSRRATHRGRRTSGGDRQQAFIAYLRDHLTGSDSIIQLVQQLSQSHRERPEGALFASLVDQLEADRDVVRCLLSDLGASTRSIKRLAGQAAGLALRSADGAPGDLSFFRALEAIAVGIQGKRCLWRAGQELSPSVRPRGPRTFADLEADAVRQWEAVERLRLSLARRTFAP